MPSRQMVVLPLPPRTVGGNEAAHPIKYHAARSAYKRDCIVAIKAARLSALTKCHLTWIFNMAFRMAVIAPGKKARISDELYRPMDKSNALRSVKAAEDALVACGVIPDDSDAYVVGHDIILNKTNASHKGASNVTLIIEEVQ